MKEEILRYVNQEIFDIRKLRTETENERTLAFLEGMEAALQGILENFLEREQ